MKIRGRTVQTQTAASDTDQPPRRRTHNGPNTTSIGISRAAHEPLRVLSQQTHTPIIELLDEAVALLLLERDEPVPPKLRAKARVHHLERR